MAAPIPLSAEQHQFVYAPPDVHQSLQSWAGTGKTHTLTERVVHLIRDHGVDPSSIIITTFTVEGARECLARLTQRLASEEQRQVNERQVNEQRQISEKTPKVGTMDSLASQWMRQFFPPADYFTGVQEYSSMLLEFLASPNGHRVKDGVRYLVVDEFQDLNRTQLDIVMEFHSTGRTHILAIGDVAQNIYEWRGCFGHFLSSLPQRIPDMQEYRLTMNRRCTPEIIAVGNACLQFMRHPSDVLMQPVRDSQGIKPIMDVLEPRHGQVGAHVLRLIRQYATARGVPYGHMAVISRYKQGLFSVEESLIKSNRHAACAEAVIPFVTSATVGQDGQDACQRRKDGHVTLMTLHQSKGLEWPLVILLLWDPATLEEEWRLLYVGVTRARDRLHIVSRDPRTATTFLNHLGQVNSAAVDLFTRPDGTPLRDSLSLSGAGNTQVTCIQSRACSTAVPVMGVVDIIRSLTPEQIKHIRAASLIPLTRGVLRPAPGCRMLRFYTPCKRFVEVSVTSAQQQDEEDRDQDEGVDEVDANGLQIEFGQFVDRLLTRLLWRAVFVVAAKSTLEPLEPLVDRDALALLETVYFGREQWEVIVRYQDLIRTCLAAAEQEKARSFIDVLHGLVDSKDVEANDVHALCSIMRRITMHCKNTRTLPHHVRLVRGRSMMNPAELVRLQRAYSGYQSMEDHHAIYHTYRVSLCSVILKGRKSMWYHPDAYGWFRKKLRGMWPCIKRYIADLTSSGSTTTTTPNMITNMITLKPTYAFGHIVGEADLLTASAVVDYKCSRRTQDFAWLGQGLAYLALASVASTAGEPVNNVHIYNPVMQTIWEYDCSSWTLASRNEFLMYLDSVAKELLAAKKK